MNWGVLGVATISLWAILLVMGIWSWLMRLLVPVITMMLLMIVPCIINCLTICLCAGQQATTVPVPQGYIKLRLTTENITHP